MTATRATATLHLIAGLPGSGKTTYATALASSTRGALFSLDRWLITAYGRYEISDIGHDEHVRRVVACRALIWSASSELLERSVDVILDDGFFLREHRAAYAAMAAAQGATTTIHHIAAPLAVLRERIERRNQALPTYNFRIDPSMLELFLAMFEIPEPGEATRVVHA